MTTTDATAPSASVQAAGKVVEMLLTGYGPLRVGEGLDEAQKQMEADDALTAQTLLLIRGLVANIVRMATVQGGVRLSEEEQQTQLHRLAGLAFPDWLGPALRAYMAATNAGHPTGGVDIDTAYGRQVSVHYAACFIVMYGVAALGENGFEDFVKDIAADLAAQG